MSPIALAVTSPLRVTCETRPLPAHGGFRGAVKGLARNPMTLGARPSTISVKAVASSHPETPFSSAARAPALVAFAAAAALTAFTLATPPSFAGADSTVVSEFNASGIVFKDYVQVVSLEDPLVGGVNIYLSDFKRSVSAKLTSGDLFSEPSQTSLACLRDETGVVVRGDLGGKEGKELFSERKNLNLFNNKTLKVRRIYDPQNNAILYVSYSTRTSSSDAEGPSAGQYKTSVCAVPLRPGEAIGATPGK